MSLKMIYAVHQSKIEPRLRHLAQTLAVFANDDGGEIWPGVVTLMGALGVEERAVRADLQALIDTRVLERDGQRRHTRKFKFNLDRLASYEPPCETGAGRRDAARRREAAKRARQAVTADPEPCTTVQGYKAETRLEPCTPVPITLHARADNPAPPCTEPCTPVPLTLHNRAPDLKDLPYVPENHEEEPGADAPALSHSEERTKDGRGELDPLVYTGIAQTAIAGANHDRDDGRLNIIRHFKSICAERSIAYDDAAAQQAIDAAIVSRAKKKRDFLAKLGECVPMKSGRYGRR